MQSQEKKSHNIAEVEVELNENRQQNLRNTTQTTSLQVKLRWLDEMSQTVRQKDEENTVTNEPGISDF